MSEAAHGADEQDERTRILQADGAIAPSGEVQAMQVALPAGAEEERTTILVHPAGDDDERTTILHADWPAPNGDREPAVGHPGTSAEYTPDPQSPRGTPEYPVAGAHDEHTAALTSPAGDTQDFASPDAHTAAAAWADEPHAGWTEDHPVIPLETEDVEETTTILTSAAGQDGGQTTILQHDRPRPEPIFANAGLPDTVQADPAQVAPTAQERQVLPAHAVEQADTDRSSSLLQQETEPQEATCILPAAALAGLQDGVDGQGSGRAWFNRRLRDFNHALLHTQTGQKRPAAERQALAAAARDMIQRVGLSDPQHKAADWTDTVLQADQLLVNTYFVRALIARGGVGEIYRARHRDLKTEHAIKILLPRYALDTTVLNLMLEEARLLQRVRHEAVVGCQGLLRDIDGRPMLVMDYLRGRTLSARLRDGPLGQADLILLAARLASGLSALHAQRLVHQDISPDNIMLVDDNCAAATIIDFGLARSLDAPENTHRNIDFAGKFSWCSPEQLSSRATQVDARSDLYSLGLVLAAAARGTRLDMGHDLASARSARHALPPLGGIAEPIATLLRHLLAPSTAARLRSADEVPEWLRARRQGFVQRLFGR